MKISPVPVIVALVVLLAGACGTPLFLRSLEAGVEAACDDRWDEAVGHWQKVLAGRPSSAAARNNLAVAFERRGQWEEARKQYEAALALDPDNPAIRGNYEKFRLRLEAARGDGR